MDITITKELTCDYIKVVRENGTVAVTDFPKKGNLPHDAVHFYVEQQLGYQHAFWGLVSQGISPLDIRHISKEGGHASAKRATPPTKDITELLQAERIVECVEANMWSNWSNNNAFHDVLVAGCAQSKIPPPTISDHDLQAIKQQLQEFALWWTALTIGESLKLRWQQTKMPQLLRH